MATPTPDPRVAAAVADGDAPPSPGRLAQLACVAEVSAPKAGNVHPGAGFDDATWTDFMVSAIAIAPLLDRAPQVGVGATALACVRATREATGSNTNLGMVLLLAPLCAAAGGGGADLRRAVERALDALTPRDAEAVYEAIRLARPGGLGRADAGDVHTAATMGLVEAMRLAAGRDAVARQYTTDFGDVFDRVAPSLARHYRGGMPLDTAIVRTHLELMAHEPDSLIRRKCGDVVAAESQRRAAAVLEAGWPAPPPALGHRQFLALDRWLRADGRRRNPGTSADLVAAGLFVALHGREIDIPWRWSGGPGPEASAG